MGHGRAAHHAILHLVGSNTQSTGAMRHSDSISTLLLMAHGISEGTVLAIRHDIFVLWTAVCRFPVSFVLHEQVLAHA